MAENITEQFGLNVEQKAGFKAENKVDMGQPAATSFSLEEVKSWVLHQWNSHLSKWVEKQTQWEKHWEVIMHPKHGQAANLSRIRKR